MRNAESVLTLSEQFAQQHHQVSSFRFYVQLDTLQITASRVQIRRMRDRVEVHVERWAMYDAELRQWISPFERCFEGRRHGLPGNADHFDLKVECCNRLSGEVIGAWLGVCKPIEHWPALLDAERDAPMPERLVLECSSIKWVPALRAE